MITPISSPPEDRFKYIDDLSVLQLICLTGLLIDYDFSQHVASDVGIDEQFLPAHTFEAQNALNHISDWTNQNLMQINEKKCNYMVISRSESKFATRLKINNTILEKTNSTKMLGVWVSDDLSRTKNCKQICIKAYSRLSMLSKIKICGSYY